MGYFLGIDGGGTHTTAWLADGEKRVVARVEVGASNPVKVGFPAAQRELLQAYRRACRAARVRPPFLDAVCAGLAGSDSLRVHRRLLGWLRKSIPARAHALTTDADITLSAAFGDGEGIIVIAGTGSIAYGRDRQGRTLRCGGWGNLFDDGGSGHDVGRKAVGCALRAFDGRGEGTRLTGAICRKLGVDSVSEVVSLPLSPQDVAALFAVVMGEAAKGDRAARRLLDEASCDLAELAATLIAGFGWKGRPCRVVCSGGVFQSSSRIRRKFAQQVRAFEPQARVSLLAREPAEGALFLARQLAESRQGRLQGSGARRGRG